LVLIKYLEIYSRFLEFFSSKFSKLSKISMLTDRFSTKFESWT
jgi:hypothetical protein